MTYDWDAFVNRVRNYPPSWHRLLSPCPHDRVAAAERQLGTLPPILEEMLQHFNGAELFIATGPMLTLFGISTIPQPSPLEWGEDWYIDAFTRTLRLSGSNRDNDWTIGMTNYGGLILFNDSKGISEWDTNESRWLLDKIRFDDWIDKITSDGDSMIEELI